MLRWIATSLLIILVAAIGFADWATGPDIGFSLLYLLPIAFTGWRLGRKTAMVVAGEAAVAWFLADLAWRSEAQLPITLWNAVTRLAIYLAIGMLTAKVRLDREQLQSLNEQLRGALQREVNLARTDAITGLPNSRYLLEYLAEELRRRHRAGEPVALIYIDLDNFKLVNDIFGHVSGDTLLQRVAEILRAELRPGEMATRMGGDEFAVLLDPATDRERMRELVSSFQQRIVGLGEDYPNSHFGVSVGTSYFDRSPEDPEQVIHSADAAMYDVKVVNKLRAISG